MPKYRVHFRGGIATVENRRWTFPDAKGTEALLNALTEGLSLGPQCGFDLDYFIACQMAKAEEGKLLDSPPAVPPSSPDAVY